MMVAWSSLGSAHTFKPFHHLLFVSVKRESGLFPWQRVSFQPSDVLRPFCCTIFTRQHSSFDLRPRGYWGRRRPLPQLCEGVMSCDVSCKVGFCTWVWWSWMELNTCKQMLLFRGTKLLACSRLALIHRKLLFPLHCFLSLFMSKFN